MLGAAPAVIKLGAAVRRAVSHPRPGSGMLRAPLRATGLGGARGAGGASEATGGSARLGGQPEEGLGGVPGLLEGIPQSAGGSAQGGCWGSLREWSDKWRGCPTARLG